MGSRGRTTCLPMFSVTRLWFSGHIWQFLLWSLNLIVGLGFPGEFFYAACQNQFVNYQNLVGLSEHLTGCGWGIFESLLTDQGVTGESVEFNIISLWWQNQSGSLKNSKQRTSAVTNKSQFYNFNLWYTSWLLRPWPDVVTTHQHWFPYYTV